MPLFLLALLGVGAFLFLKTGSPATPTPNQPPAPAPGANILSIVTGHWYKVSLAVSPAPPVLPTPAMGALQQEFDGEFPGLFKVISVSTNGQDTIVAVVQALTSKQLPLPFQPVSFEGFTVTPSVIEVSAPEPGPMPGPPTHLPPLPAALPGPPPPAPPASAPPAGGPGIAQPLVPTLDVFYTVPGTPQWKPFCTTLMPLGMGTAMLLCKFPDTGNDLATYMAQQTDSGTSRFAMIFQRNDANPAQSLLVVWPWVAPGDMNPRGGHQIAMPIAPHWGQPVTFVTDPTTAQPSLQTKVALATQAQQGLSSMPNPDYVYWHARRTPTAPALVAHGGVIPLPMTP
jgi:hypothetical protein